MSLIGRFFVILLALSVAIATAAVTMGLVALSDPVFGRMVMGAARLGVEMVVSLLEATETPEKAIRLLMALWSAAVTIVAGPPVIAGLVGEVARRRTFVWYSGISGALAALMPWVALGAARTPTPDEMRITLSLFFVGAMGGLAYWAVARMGWTPAPPRLETPPASAQPAPSGPSSGPVRSDPPAGAGGASPDSAPVSSTSMPG